MPAESRHRRLLANRYQLTELIGSGAMGQVYRAEDKLLGGVIVAVKFLSQALLNKKMKERFEREATISALLGEKSIHIVKVRDYGVDEKEIPFYVMEFLQGESLSDIIKFHPLPLSRFLNLARQICFGMECAHKGILYQGELCSIIHRDIKPSNILVTQDSALGELVKILDFGIAKLVQSGGDQTQSFMGTLAYCSPEQMEGKELDSSSDIYSLGIMMYEMLTGDMPLLPENSSFGGWYEVHHYVSPQPFNPTLKIPLGLQNLIRKCLEKAPQDRPQNIGEILQALEQIELAAKPVYREEKEQRFNFPPTLPPDNRPEFGSRERTISVSLPAKEVCLQSQWPKDKPQQKIVFPHIMGSKDGPFASLWVMLEKPDILTSIASIRYNQFLFIPTPHPMILWITVLYHREHGPRWLPCYLDLKTLQGQQLTRALGELGNYWILFFALEDPNKCERAITASIAPTQCERLKDWGMQSQNIRPGKPQISKRMLKRELDKLKPKIIAKLESGVEQIPSNV
ncbi:serine/threonine protein kinase [Gloeothece citriformis PCC 7424]|uniref:Serine/threonine protein kinase n=1 Tax=Gloeothece citriformis (strain PCC 7424) TaxID=65393 RepID=B7KIQ8_GLOC7|nr:serine/threonine-protein kinase [Gloeothece citriformis]ACK69464.1 serine/threonine protein kinase [Gloeothece citriformis PCC 7424]